MSFRLVTPPTDYPVTVAQVMAQTRIDSTAEATLLQDYIADATAAVESHTGRAIMPQTWELLLDDFSDAIMLSKGPVTSVVSVKYYDEDDVLQTVADTDYATDLASDPQWLVRSSEFTWPPVADGVNNVIIRFVAGCEPTLPIFRAHRRAILLTVNSWFDDRSAGGLPQGAMDLLIDHRSHA
jgi:uncharacterized phiE125 gp8 family phage protein